MLSSPTTNPISACPFPVPVDLQCRVLTGPDVYIVHTDLLDRGLVVSPILGPLTQYGQAGLLLLATCLTRLAVLSLSSGNANHL